MSFSSRFGDDLVLLGVLSLFLLFSFLVSADYKRVVKWWSAPGAPPTRPAQAEAPCESYRPDGAIEWDDAVDDIPSSWVPEDSSRDRGAASTLFTASDRLTLEDLSATGLHFRVGTGSYSGYARSQFETVRFYGVGVEPWKRDPEEDRDGSDDASSDLSAPPPLPSSDEDSDDEDQDGAPRYTTADKGKWVPRTHGDETTPSMSGPDIMVGEDNNLPVLSLPSIDGSSLQAGWVAPPAVVLVVETAMTVVPVLWDIISRFTERVESLPADLSSQAQFPVEMSLDPPVDPLDTALAELSPVLARMSLGPDDYAMSDWVMDRPTETVPTAMGRDVEEDRMDLDTERNTELATMETDPIATLIPGIRSLNLFGGGQGAGHHQRMFPVRRPVANIAVAPATTMSVPLVHPVTVANRGNNPAVPHGIHAAPAGVSASTPSWARIATPPRAAAALPQTPSIPVKVVPAQLATPAVAVPQDPLTSAAQVQVQPARPVETTPPQPEIPAEVLWPLPATSGLMPTVLGPGTGPSEGWATSEAPVSNPNPMFCPEPFLTPDVTRVNAACFASATSLIVEETTPTLDGSLLSTSCGRASDSQYRPITEQEAHDLHCDASLAAHAEMAGQAQLLADAAADKARMEAAALFSNLE